jgi:hypothetical protein
MRGLLQMAHSRPGTPQHPSELEETSSAGTSRRTPSAILPVLLGQRRLSLAQAILKRIEILIQALVGMLPQFLPSVFHALTAEPISFFLTVRVLPRRVIHVVGPVWRGLKDAEIEVRGTITGIDGESRTTSCAIKPSKINGDVCSVRSDALFSTAQGRMQRWALRAERMASQRQG